LLLNILESSLDTIEDYIVLRKEEWQEFKKKVLDKASSKLFLIVFTFWMTYSFYHIFILNGVWWKTNYNSQLIINIYGYLAQGINGCLLGGIFMTLVSIDLNRAIRTLHKHKVFSKEIITEKGKKKLSGFKKLILTATIAAAIVSAIAISIWSPLILYTPIIGSLIMILPTAVYPHYIFYKILSKAKEEKIETLEEDIKNIPSSDKATIGDLI